MYNKLYKHLPENNYLYRKQFGFQKRHYKACNCSVSWTTVQLFIYSCNCSFTLGMFINLSKAFEAIDYHNLLKKLEYYSVAVNNLRSFEN